MRRVLPAIVFLLVLRLSSSLAAQCLQKPDRRTEKNAPKEPLTVSTPVLLSHATHRVTPVFPEAARNAKIDGAVQIALEVSHEGAVTETRPLSGDTLLRPAAEEAVKQWHFEPFCKKGVPYIVRGVLEFQFRWRGEGSHLADHK